MSSGTLPLSTYHRAQSLGAGAYGSVVTVYDDDGNEFALKLFDDDDDDDGDSEEEEYDEYEEESEDDDENDGENSDEEQGGETSPMDLGALREISILRLLRHDNSHPNVIAISDVKQANDITEEEDCGDVTMHHVGIAMSLFHHGTLTDAIESGSLDKRNKVQLAHGILSSIAFLHANGIIHRDIKTDNIMVEIDDDGIYKPVLIDFSLGKIVEPKYLYGKASEKEVVASMCSSSGVDADAAGGTNLIEGEDTHTPSTGTPTYRAPECVNEQPYGLPSDMYSIGVVLLELLRESCIESFKDRGAQKIVMEALESLPDQPFANIVRGLLEQDPVKRWTAKFALNSPLFEKFGLKGVNHDKTFGVIDINDALPLDNDEDLDSKKHKKRLDLIQKIAHDLDCKNPLTIQAAYSYSTQLAALDDCLDEVSASQGLVDCVVLASRFLEQELWNLDDIEELDRGILKKCQWSPQEYVDNEGTIWMLMDFCLYPRLLVDF